MIKAKLLAMCVCPALTAPPAILAVSPPARHAVAHVLHHAANRLEPRAAVADAQQLAALPCAPSLAAGDGALPVVGSAGEGLGGIGVANLASVGTFPASSGTGQAASGGNTGYGGGGYGGGFGGGGYGGGFAGGGGGMNASPAVSSPGSSTAGGETIPAPNSGSTNAGVPVAPTAFSAPLPQPVFGPGGSASTAPEPAAWMLMITGFGLVGTVVRVKRPAATTGPRLTFQQTA